MKAPPVGICGGLGPGVGTWLAKWLLQGGEPTHARLACAQRQRYARLSGAFSGVRAEANAVCALRGGGGRKAVLGSLRACCSGGSGML
jgi:hypothetical protein